MQCRLCRAGHSRLLVRASAGRAAHPFVVARSRYRGAHIECVKKPIAPWRESLLKTMILLYRKLLAAAWNADTQLTHGSRGKIPYGGRITQSGHPNAAAMTSRCVGSRTWPAGVAPGP